MEKDQLSINKDFKFQDEDIISTSINYKVETKLDKIIEKKRNQIQELPFSKKKTKKVGNNADKHVSSDEDDTVEQVFSKESGLSVSDTLTNPNPMTSFQELHLSRPMQKALVAMNFVKPTPIQSVVIPVALAGKDVLGGATTGSGKTAAFLVPIIERLLYRSRSVPASRVLILLPTRELAVQCFDVGKQLSQFTDIDLCLLAGGLPIRPQEQALKKRPDILVATPGRLVDLIQNCPSFHLDTLEILVLDEADRILEIGFKEELDFILQACPKQRQTMLFSATMNPEMLSLVSLSLNKPVQLMIDSNEAIAANLAQEFIRIRPGKEAEREAIVLALCSHYFTERVILFFQTKVEAHRMKVLFALHNLDAVELHGNLSQEERLRALLAFKQGAVNFMLATDVAARGLDIVGVQTVINFSMPLTFAQYQHRIGRTARAGKSGKSVSLITEADRKLLKLAIKNSQDTVKQRSIPSDKVANYLKSIVDLKDKIEEILTEEKESKELDIAQMELTKAQNLVNHADEIYSRPKRTFISTKRKSNQ